jgi:DNA ligase (NAD+)
VRDLADIYRLAGADFESLDGFAERSAGQLFDAIQSAKRPRLDRFLYGLGIRHVGSRTAKLIAGELRALDAVAAAAARDIEVIPEIGEEIAASVVRFFHEPKNRAVLRHLHEAGVDVRPMPSGPKEQPLAGKVFVFTGRLEGYTRVQASRRIEAMGGRVTSSVSGETDYLVVGEDPGSKLDAAREQEVEVLDEAGFRKLIGDS